MENLHPLFKIAAIIAKQKNGTITDAEHSILQNWLSENDKNKSIFQKLQNNEYLSVQLNDLNSIDTPHAYTSVLKQISEKEYGTKPVKGYSYILKYAAVAAVLIIAAYFVIPHMQKETTTIVAQQSFTPGHKQAILVASNNKEIKLDSVSEKIIADNGLARITQNKTNLRYNKITTSSSQTDTLQFNTLITPRGGEYSITLSDGTEVFLNADSKLIYPVVFSQKSRKVILEGEAYFKVAHSSTQPFIVNTNNVDLTVYGTIFNVSSYANDPIIHTTLVEGSVGLSIKNKAETIIAPGEQWQYNKKTEEITTNTVDTEQFIAWTKGRFMFENEPIENILTKMARWYNFKFAFKDSSIKDQRFSLSLNRDEDVSKILHLFSAASSIKFSIQKDTILVSK